MFNEDFQDFIKSLNKFGVEYMLVGGYAVILRGYSRSTGDMDIWVNKTQENYQQLQLAIIEFGLPAAAVMQNQFFSTEYDVFSFGKPPYAIDIMTAVKGVEFIPAFQQSTVEQVDGLPMRVIQMHPALSSPQTSAPIKVSIIPPHI